MDYSNDNEPYMASRGLRYFQNQDDGHTRFARDSRKPINQRLENHYSFNPKRRLKLGKR